MAQNFWDQFEEEKRDEPQSFWKQFEFEPTRDKVPVSVAGGALNEAKDALERAEILRPQKYTPPAQQVSEEELAALDEAERPKSMWERTWDPLWKAPQTIGKAFAEGMTEPRLGTGNQAFDEGLAMLKGGIGGIGEGIGGAISGFTSPGDIAAMIATGGASRALGAGIKGAQAIKRAAQAINAMPIIHGGQTIADPNASWTDVGMGLAEMAGGGAGMHITANAKPTPKPEARPGRVSVTQVNNQPVNVPPPESMANVVPPELSPAPMRGAEAVSAIQAEKNARTMLRQRGLSEEQLRILSNTEIIQLAQHLEKQTAQATAPQAPPTPESANVVGLPETPPGVDTAAIEGAPAGAGFVSNVRVKQQPGMATPPLNPPPARPPQQLPLDFRGTRNPPPPQPPWDLFRGAQELGPSPLRGAGMVEPPAPDTINAMDQPQQGAFDFNPVEGTPTTAEPMIGRVDPLANWDAALGRNQPPPERGPGLRDVENDLLYGARDVTPRPHPWDMGPVPAEPAGSVSLDPGQYSDFLGETEAPLVDKLAPGRRFPVSDEIAATLPPEFQPDVIKTDEPIPGTGGTSPIFRGRQSRGGEGAPPEFGGGKQDVVPFVNPRERQLREMFAKDGYSQQWIDEAVQVLLEDEARIARGDPKYGPPVDRGPGKTLPFEREGGRKSIPEEGPEFSRIRHPRSKTEKYAEVERLNAFLSEELLNPSQVGHSSKVSALEGKITNLMNEIEALTAAGLDADPIQSPKPVVLDPTIVHKIVEDLVRLGFPREAAVKMAVEMMEHPGGSDVFDAPDAPDIPDTSEPTVRQEVDILRAKMEQLRAQGAFSDAPRDPDLPRPNLRTDPVGLKEEIGKKLEAKQLELEKTPEELAEEDAVASEIDDQIGLPEEGKPVKVTTQMKVDARNSAKELTSGYSAPIHAIMVREGLQNALDAVKSMLGMGKVKIALKKQPFGAERRNSLEMGDNGPGMSPQELLTVFSTLHKSGKLRQSGATGGKGVGKATYILGGDYFHVTTVKEINGKKIESVFEGDPETILTKFDIESRIVDPDTPTGTQFLTVFNKEQDLYTAENMLDKIMERSRGLTTQIETQGWNGDYNPIGWQTAGDNKKAAVTGHMFDDKTGKLDAFANVGTSLGERASFPVHVLNNGMYQYSKQLYLDEATRGLPDSIAIDVKPLVPELSNKYPFPVQRESLKEGLWNEVEKMIKDKVLQGVKDEKYKDLFKLWQQMPALATSKSGREIVFFDPGERLASHELIEMMEAPTTKSLLNGIDSLVDSILNQTSKPWIDKVVRVGITLDPNMAGVHIPNPSSGMGGTPAQSAILLNPFATLERAAYSDTPVMDASTDMIVTGLHEVAHVGKEDVTSTTPLSVGDINDPRVGRFLQTFIKETYEQGGLNPAHGFAFIKRLGDIYGRFGTRRFFEAHDTLSSAISDPGNPGQFNPEVEKLLQLYTESRGRDAVTEDVLSGTGVRQEITSGGRRNVPSGDQPAGTRASAIYLKKPTAESLAAALKEGYRLSGVRDDGAVRLVLPSGLPNLGDPVAATILNAARQGNSVPPASRVSPETPIEMPPPPDPTGNPVADRMTWKDYLSVPRAIQSAIDLSFPFRQGLGLIHTKGWWDSWEGMIKSVGDEEAFNAVQDSIRQHKDFQQTFDQNGKVQKSFAEEAGLFMTDLGDLTTREESMGTKYAEKIPVLGKGIRASNRAYVAFANKLRSDVFISLIDEAEAMGLDPRSDMTLAKSIAKYVNNASGRGDAKLLESSAVILNQLLFSPRLMASRLQMLNPKNYLMLDEFTRRQYQKSAMAMGAAYLTFATASKILGGEVNIDPNAVESSDFGRIKFGNTRIDPTGGFLPYLTLAARIGRGTAMQMRGDKGARYTGKFGSRNQWDDFSDFVGAKASPLARPVYEIMTSRDYKPFMAGDSAIRMFTPIQLQELSEVIQDDPELSRLLGVTALGVVGVGSNTYKERTPPTRLLGATPQVGKFFGEQWKDPFPMEYDFTVPRKHKFTR